MKHLSLINRALDALEKSTQRAITVAKVPAIQQAYEQELLAVQAARVDINQKDFFKS